MATLLDNLKARRDAIGAELAALTSAKPGGTADTTGGEGLSHVAYKDGLYRELKELNEQIAVAEGGWQEESLLY